MKTFGEIIKEMRQERGWTQWKLAEKAGVSQHAISYWENDEHYPDILTAADLADVFECTLDELIGREV